MKCVQYYDRCVSKILTYITCHFKCHTTVIVTILIPYFKNEATEAQGGDITGSSSTGLNPKLQSSHFKPL